MHITSTSGLIRKACLIGVFATTPWPFALDAHAQTPNAVLAINEAAAKSDITVTPLRGGLSMLAGSGGNIIVLNGKNGKLVVDSGIAVSQARVEQAIAKLGPGKIKILINTHYHWDHTDGNRWMYKSGATIIAHENSLKRDSVAVTVDDWHYTFQPLPPAARPTVLVKNEKTITFEGAKVMMKHFDGGHTDSDIWVYFPDADVLALGDAFWNGMYPYIDHTHGGGIQQAILWTDKALEKAGPNTIVVPGHGVVGDRAALMEFRTMLVQVRDKVDSLKKQGKSLDEIIAAKPTAAFDAKFGGSVIVPDVFTRLVYVGL